MTFNPAKSAGEAQSVPLGYAEFRLQERIPFDIDRVRSSRVRRWLAYMEVEAAASVANSRTN